MYNLREKKQRILNNSTSSKSLKNTCGIRIISEDGYPLTDPRSSIWKGNSANCAVVLPYQNSSSGIKIENKRPSFKGKDSLGEDDAVNREAKIFESVIEKGKDLCTSPPTNASQISSISTQPTRYKSSRSSGKKSHNCVFKLPTTNTEKDLSSCCSDSEASYDERIYFSEPDNSQDKDYVETGDNDHSPEIEDSCAETEAEDSFSYQSDSSRLTSNEVDLNLKDSAPETMDSIEMINDYHRSTSAESSQKKKKAPNVREFESEAHTSSSKKYADGWRGFKLGFDVSKAPLTTIDEIFEHLTGRFAKHNLFAKMMQHLNGHPIRVATMCSGTECPVIAMEFIRDILAKSGQNLNFDHVFSVEIEPFKQAYISRNYPDLLVFRDICELARSYTADKMATTALGASALVPENIDLLITGFCCVDFSNLNNNPKSLLERGESGDTFCAAVAFIMKGKPKIVIFENVLGAPWSDIKLRKDQKAKIRSQYQKTKNKTLIDSELNKLYETLVREERISEGIDVTMEKAGYSCQLIKMDTKDFYLPQTRQRGYMICIRNDILVSKGTVNAQQIARTTAKEYLKEVEKCVLSFKYPATVSCETMLLAVADETAVPVERLEEIDEERDKIVAWVRSAEEHTRYRSDLGLGSNRKLTFWSENGWKLLPDFYTHMKAFTERVLDCLEIAHLRNVRRGFDDRFYSRLLELSQNCFRASDKTKTGIMPCLTPSGIPFWSSEGRRLTGRETLTLQGIPVHRIDLSFLTETHLRDLTGNAMSSTAVGVCIISSLLIFSKYLDRGDSESHVRGKETPNFSHEDDLYEFKKDPEIADSTLSVSDILKYARSSIKLCWCEKRDEILDRKFKMCTVCQHTICQVHAGNPKHEYKILNLDRSSPFTFEKLLRRTLPKKIDLKFLAERLKAINFIPKNITGFENDRLAQIVFRALQSEMFFINIKRSDIWEVFYESLHAKYVLRISTLTVEWLLYAKPPRKLAVEDSTRQFLEKFAIARMTPEPQEITTGQWELWIPEERSVPAKIEWIGKLYPSFRNDRGLVSDQNVEIFNTWRIQASQEGEFPDISGDYHLQQECGRAMNSLHVRKETSSQPRLFLYFDHDKKTGDYKNHSYIFSQDARDLEYGVSRTAIARIPASVGEPEVKKIFIDGRPKYMTYRLHPLQEPNKTQDSEILDDPPTLCVDKIYITSDGFWRVIPDQKIFERSKNSQETTTINYGYLKDPKIIGPLNSDSCQKLRAVFSCKTTVPVYIANLFQREIWNSVSTKNSRDVYHYLSGFLLDGLIIPDYVHEREIWHKVQINDRKRCTVCAPVSPPILWHLNAKQMPKPFEHLAHASEYEKNLKKRPATLSQVFMIDSNHKLTFKIGINFQSLIHRAASVFEDGDIIVSWRLITDNLSMTRPSLPKFRIKDTTKLTPTSQWENKKFPLRLEQRRSVAWQIKNELSTEAFFEEEIVEDGIRQLGYQVLVKASRQKIILGGLLAHEVGFGKTVIILALIDHQTKFDISWGKRPSTERIHSRATVIFVPLSLTTQWYNEIRKFLPHIADVIIIRNLKDLRKCTIKNIRNANIILVNSNILQSEGYLFDLSQFAGMLAPDWTASSRAKKSWHETAMKKVSESLNILMKDTSDLASYLAQNLYNSKLEAQKTERPYPSRRYTGRMYMEKKTAKKDDQIKQRDPNHTGSREQNTTNKNEVLLENKYPISPKEWESMTHVVFEMFSFARIVVDEYHYLTPGQIISISAIESRCRWLLSATPLLDTFEQFKQVAELLGIYLGREDYSSMAPEVFKSRVFDMTVSERFLAFDKPSSPAWLRARYNQMQLFLDAFVRKDVAILSAFDTEETVHLVHQPVAERAFYLELEQLLAANQFQIPRTRAKNSEGEFQAQLALANFKLAEQALLNGASFFNARAYISHKKKLECALDATDISLQNRKLDLEALKSNISKDLRRAEWLQNNFAECSNISNYLAFKKMVQNIGIQDSQASDILLDLVVSVQKNVQSYDWRRDFLEPGKTAFKEGKTSHSMLAYPSGFIQDQGKMVSAPTRYLRTITSSLDNAAKRLTKLVRALRYMKNVKACYNLAHSNDQIACGKCFLPVLRSENVIVLGSCGHIICVDCNLKTAGYCLVETCGAAFQIYQQFSGNEFIVKHRSLEEENFGSKIADLIGYLKKVPENEKVLLFVQEDSAIEKLLAALDKARLSSVLLGGRNPASIIESFQKGRLISDTSGAPKTERSILVLNIGDSSAAGSNLTIANHVIFFAPYFTTGTSAAQKFKHAMEQGIGRAVRYGQTKKVFITHFLTSRTHDVDLFEHRKHCCLTTPDPHNPHRALITELPIALGDADAQIPFKSKYSSLTCFLHEHL